CKKIVAAFTSQRLIVELQLVRHRDDAVDAPGDCCYEIRLVRVGNRADKRCDDGASPCGRAH
ncbi:hypothetical protein QZM93_38755, partial [Burkholderia cepacia]|uniref:hypothetical protein n=1 Tax=Burkholderia cepacia TaxID=292 RepID=UPI0026509215